MEINVVPPRGKCFSVGLRVPTLGNTAISTAPCTALVSLIKSQNHQKTFKIIQSTDISHQTLCFSTTSQCFLHHLQIYLESHQTCSFWQYFQQFAENTASNKGQKLGLKEQGASLLQILMVSTAPMERGHRKSSRIFYLDLFFFFLNKQIAKQHNCSL